MELTEISFINQTEKIKQNFSLPEIFVTKKFVSAKSEDTLVLSFLQKAQLRTQQAISSALIKIKQTDPSKNVYPLVRYSWNEVISQDSYLIKKTIECRKKTLEFEIQQERTRKYLEICWNNFKKNFQQHLLKL